jgi:hypothetical protein
MRRWPPFVSPEGLAELDFVARRYGERPCRLLGIDPDADEAALLLAYHIDRAAAHAGVWQEVSILNRPAGAKATPTTKEPTFDPKFGLTGRIPVNNNASVPAWLEAHFPEGPIRRPDTA